MNVEEESEKFELRPMPTLLALITVLMICPCSAGAASSADARAVTLADLFVSEPDAGAFPGTAGPPRVRAGEVIVQLTSEAALDAPSALANGKAPAARGGGSCVGRSRCHNQ